VLFKKKFVRQVHDFRRYRMIRSRSSPIRSAMWRPRGAGYASLSWRLRS